MDATTHFAAAAFIVLAVVSLAGFLRHPGTTRRDVCVMFCSLAIAAGATILGEALFVESRAPGVIARLAVVLQPYLLFRVVRHLRRVPTVPSVVAKAGAIVSAFALLLLPEPIPVPVVVFIAAYFVLVNGFLAGVLIQGAMRSTGISRSRLRLAAAGCLLLALAVIFAAARAITLDPPTFLTYAVQLAALTAASSLYMGFVPPRVLRTVWNNEVLRRFLTILSSGTSDDTRVEVAKALHSVARETTGSDTVAIATQEIDDTRWFLSILGPEANDATEFSVAESEVPGNARLYQHLESGTPSATRAQPRDVEALGVQTDKHVNREPEWIYVVPATSRGRLRHCLIVLAPSGSLFTDDALQTLSLCTEQAAITIERIDLVDKLRGQSAILETQVEKRTALFQRLSRGFETLYQISDAAHSNAPVEEILQFALTTICQREGFHLGHLVSPEHESAAPIVPDSLWYPPQDDDQYAPIRHAVDRLGTSEQLDCIREALFDDEPYWVTGTKQLANCIRSPDATLAGLQTGIFVPVFVDEKLVTVLEFFSHEAKPKTDVPLRILKEAGRMLGHVIAQRKAAREIASNEAFFRNTFEQASAGIAHASPDGRLIKVNRRWAQILGYSVEELLKVRFMDITVPEDLERERSYFTRLAEGQISNYTIEKRYIAKDGSHVWVDLTTSAVYRADGTLDYFIGVILDIEERKKLERELRDLTEHLENRVEQQTAHLRAINQELEAFSYSVSHDLRTPLRAIEGFSAALEEDYAGALDETARDYIERLRSETKRMGRLIDDMLTLSRLSRTEMRMQQVDLGPMAREIFDELGSAEPDREVSVQIDDPIEVCADPTLTQVLMQNLINNAWKFTSRTASSHIHIGRNNAGEFFVGDNGAGFDMRYADKLFGAFQRLHTTHEFEGTGIGLATVQRIVNRHGGSIHAEAEENNGAVFTFTLGNHNCE